MSISRVHCRRAADGLKELLRTVTRRCGISGMAKLNELWIGCLLVVGRELSFAIVDARLPTLGFFFFDPTADDAFCREDDAFERLGRRYDSL